MKNLDLNDTEYIILKKEYANDGKHAGEFFITNENLIFFYRVGIFNTKDINCKIPLSSIKKHNGEYQIFYNDDSEIMELYCSNGQYEFSFDTDKDAEEVIDAIKKVSKQLANNENISKEAHLVNNNCDSDNSEHICCQKCGAKNENTYKFCIECGNKLLIKKDFDSNKNSNNKKVFKCKGCGALVEGNIYDKVKCEYCDLIQILS